MAIGILYESKEWSSTALQKNIVDLGIQADLIDMQQDCRLDSLLRYSLIINRVFASSLFRGHHKALRQMPDVIEFLRKNSIPAINSYDAHFYEISKQKSTLKLGEQGISVPEVYGVFTREEVMAIPKVNYPCIVKPDCGGRTNCTFIVDNPEQLAKSMDGAPDVDFILQEYIQPEFGFLTRVEVIGGECRLILKRSVVENGLSAYHLGSTYAPYPDCSEKLKNAAVKAMDVLGIQAGSMDIIENNSGFYIIDVNSVSNTSEDCTEMFDFDLMKETARYIAGQYNRQKNMDV